MSAPSQSIADPKSAAAKPATVVQKSERDRFVALAFCWGDLLFELNDTAVVTFCAGPVEMFTGLKPEDVVGMEFLRLVAPSDSAVALSILKTALNRGRLDGEALQLRRGSRAMLSVYISGYFMDEKYYLALRLKGGKTTVEPLPRHDQIGTLQDTQTFASEASRRIKSAEAGGQKAEMTVLGLTGLDELRQRLDEVETRALLSSVGACLSSSSPEGNVATQLGSDSFGLIHDPSLDLILLQGRLLDVVRAVAPAGASVQIDHTTVPIDGAQEVSEQDLAKGLMYALGAFQKKSGSEFNISSLTSNISNLISQGISDIRDFRRILSERNFFVAVQPIVNTKSGHVHHFEALCRFDVTSPDTSPYRYITFAEETGMIHEFDLAMAAKVVKWLGKMPINNQKYSVAVNISGFSIGVPEYVRSLHYLLKRNPWTRDRLMFEITESARMSDLEAANEFIQGLRRAGYKVCLDDFGAGAASFQYLSALEVDVVKIDGSAVRNAQKAPKGRAFLSALSELCTRLGVETIAEMIDSPEALRFVRDCRCDYVQGFLFGKPSPNFAEFSPLPNIELFR
jgi:EAL domain-containing protein (putative c-di-GMP-specific phosphodiesterase class I)